MATSWPWEEHTLWMADSCMEIDDRPRLSTVNSTATAGGSDPCSATTNATTSSTSANTRSRKRMRDTATYDNVVDFDMSMGESDTTSVDPSAGSVDVVMARPALKRRRRLQLDCLSNSVEDALSESEPQLSSAPSSEPATPSDWPEPLPSPSTMTMLESMPLQSSNHNTNTYVNDISNSSGSSSNSYPTMAAILYPHEESMRHEVIVSNSMHNSSHDDPLLHVWESQTLASELDAAAQLAWRQVYASSNRILHDAHWTRRHRLQPNVNISDVSSNHHLSALTATAATAADSSGHSIHTNTTAIINSPLSSTSSTETIPTLTVDSSPYASFNAMLAQLHRAREQRH
ncbi:hypothetical protein BDF22DRAFT_73453 [Syncephalis plumigaleata]|nr:hypothetical protein BDF22DRAFT_73453 [Syncephalis plumigaleata]